MPDNPLTDQKKFVEIIPVQSFWGIFNRTYTAEDGFSLELFRGNTYLGSVRSNEITNSTKSSFQRSRLHNNDTILRINLGYRTLDIKCQLPMRGDWVCSYEGIVKIAVHDPYLFALQYQQEADPVRLAMLAIEDAIKRYARRCEHDHIDDNTVRYEVRIALLKGTHKNYGLEVVEVLSSTIHPDTKKAQMIDIRQQGMIKDEQIHTDADNAYLQAQRDGNLQSLKGVQARGEQEKDETFRLKLDKVQKEHDREQSFLDAVNEGLKRNMLNDISNGVSPEVLVRRYPQFASVLGFPAINNSLPGGKQPPLIKNTDRDKLVGVEATTGKFTVLPPSSATSSESFYNARIGVSLVHIPLSDRQRQRWGIENQVAFMVSRIDEKSVAEQAFMEPNDIIIEIDDQPVSSATILMHTLDTMEPGVPLEMRVLRDGQPLDLELAIL
jgi:PDZ domain